MSPKKKALGHSKRLDPKDYGIDLDEILDEIEPHLEGKTHAEVAEKAGLSPGTVPLLRGRFRTPSLAALAALAKAAGGRLKVVFVPPPRKKKGSEK